MTDELTSKMHSEFTMDSDTDISHRVSCVVDELNEGFGPIEVLLKDYNVTKAQYNKYKTKWEKLLE